MHPTRVSKFLILTALAAALAACPDRTAPLEVTVIKPSDCGVGPDPLESVAFIRVRVIDVESEQIVIEHKVDVSSGKLDLSNVPAGREMRLEIAGLDADEYLLSIGRSAPFLIPDEFQGAAPVTKVSVFLRAVDKWSPVVSASSPSTRTALLLPRGGHTATLLDDGRVLIAGGFQAANKNTASWRYLAGVEVFDPLTGEITTEYPDMTFQEGSTTPRAFHSAVKLPSGKVLISGGEMVSGSPAQMTTVNNSVLFTPDAGENPWVPIVTMKKWRSHHTATLEQNGRVLLFGGIDWASDNRANYVSTYEWFDSEPERFNLPSDLNSFTRLGHGAVALGGGQFIAVAGGSVLPQDGNTPRLAGGNEESVRFFKYDRDQDKMLALSSPVAIDTPRSWVAAAEIGSARLLVLGGFTGFDSNKPWDLFPSDPYNGSDVISTRGTIKREPGPGVFSFEGEGDTARYEGGRGHICALTLPDGRVMAIGGRGVPDRKYPTRIESMTSNTTYAEDPDTGEIKGYRAEPLLQARYFHTCTLLADGSVLATGGVLEQGATGAITTLDSMEIYVPRPQGE